MFYVDGRWPSFRTGAIHFRSIEPSIPSIFFILFILNLEGISVVLKTLDEDFLGFVYLLDTTMYDVGTSLWVLLVLPALSLPSRYCSYTSGPTSARRLATITISAMMAFSRFTVATRFLQERLLQVRLTVCICSLHTGYTSSEQSLF